ncbi:hypothetical protein [Xanthomonas massiliensis]|uniref:hypothetical protein n=1 Tax=Xanthomonas massiliensis TaxID=1720302 RepID=UPI0008245B79|nr:hypothetical protein [Xanthomonas massiliensis]
MKLHRDLLFHHGHVTNADLARALAEDPPESDGAHGSGQSGAEAEDDCDAPVRGRTTPENAAPGTTATCADARYARLVRMMTALSPFR